MGLHDRLRTGTEREQLPERHLSLASQPQPRRGERGTSDPYAELKTRIHHAVIAKLGPELFSKETTEDLNERVLRAVTEQLMLDRTPLTSEGCR